MIQQNKFYCPNKVSKKVSKSSFTIYEDLLVSNSKQESSFLSQGTLFVNQLGGVFDVFTKKNSVEHKVLRPPFEVYMKGKIVCITFVHEFSALNYCLHPFPSDPEVTSLVNQSSSTQVVSTNRKTGLTRTTDRIKEGSSQNAQVGRVVKVLV